MSSTDMGTANVDTGDAGSAHVDSAGSNQGAGRIDPDLERFMAKRMGARTIEVKASHLALISHPVEIANLILEAAGHR